VYQPEDEATSCRASKQQRGLCLAWALGLAYSCPSGGNSLYPHVPDTHFDVNAQLEGTISGNALSDLPFAGHNYVQLLGLDLGCHKIQELADVSNKATAIALKDPIEISPYPTFTSFVWNRVLQVSFVRAGHVFVHLLVGH
jgi:hypothetical protein